MCIRATIYGSIAFLVLLPIDIYNIHIITEMLCTDNIDFLAD